ncbi:MAG: YtxH domain-containing protein [Bacteroidaceae bacterium]|nr:YtxH domain-containing protein [Bacteroidaceae bacterium]
MRVCNYAAFAGGVLVGGVIALLFAPKKGVELRADIKQKLGDVKKHVDETIAMCGNSCNGGECVNVTVEE